MRKGDREKDKPVKSERARLLERFDKEAFFRYVEGYVLSSLNKDGVFEPGKIEWFIVDYFDRHVFTEESVQYVPEFAEAIFELLHKHKDKLVSFVTTSSRTKDAMFPEDSQRLYATLLLPNFSESRALFRIILEIEVMHRRRMNKLSNRLKRKWNKLRRSKNYHSITKRVKAIVVLYRMQVGSSYGCFQEVSKRM